MAGLTAEVFCVAISSWWSRRGAPTPRSFMTQTLALTQLSLHPWRCFCWETPCNPCNLSFWAGLFVYLTFAYPLFPGCNAAIFYSKTRPATPAFADYVFVFGLLGGWCFQGSLEVSGHASAMNGIMFAAGAQLVTVFAGFSGYEVEVVAYIAGRLFRNFGLNLNRRGEKSKGGSPAYSLRTTCWIWRTCSKSCNLMWSALWSFWAPEFSEVLGALERFALPLQVTFPKSVLFWIFGDPRAGHRKQFKNMDCSFFCEKVSFCCVFEPLWGRTRHPQRSEPWSMMSLENGGKCVIAYVCTCALAQRFLPEHPTRVSHKSARKDSFAKDSGKSGSEKFKRTA